MIHFVGNDSIFNCCKRATIEDVVNYCHKKHILAVDTETEGFDFTCKKVVMFQIGDEKNQFVIDTRFVSIEPLREQLESKKIILHNAKFDYKFIKKWFGIELNHIWDTMLVEQVMNCGKDNIRYGLYDVCDRYLNVKLDKSVRNQFVGLKGKPFDEQQIVYGAKDVEYLINIYTDQNIKLKELDLEKVASLENKACLAFADIEYNGLYINKEAWSKIADRSKSEARTLETEMDELVEIDNKLHDFVAKELQGDLFTPVVELRKVNVKWSSPTQVVKVFKKLVPNLENVNAKFVGKYRRHHDIINKYIIYKEKMKLATSYGRDFFKFILSDGKIHTGFYQILDTGRVSSSNPNMQQIPADNLFRNCFVAPDGWKFVSGDYKSQELNVIAFGSKDPVWLEILERDGDLHSECASLVFGEKWDNANEIEKKKLRTMIKTVNFGLAYCMGPNKLADTLDISIDQAKKLIDKYFKSFPRIKNFLNILGDYGKRHGHIKTFAPYRRIRWFNNWWPKIYEDANSAPVLGSIERASKNTPIQGTSADMTKYALALLRGKIQICKLPVKLVMTVHDQIDTICHTDYAEEWAETLKGVMEEAAKKVITNGLLKADVNISESWQK